MVVGYKLFNALTLEWWISMITMVINGHEELHLWKSLDLSKTPGHLEFNTMVWVVNWFAYLGWWSQLNALGRGGIPVASVGKFKHQTSFNSSSCDPVWWLDLKAKLQIFSPRLTFGEVKDMIAGSFNLSVTWRRFRREDVAMSRHSLNGRRTKISLEVDVRRFPGAKQKGAKIMGEKRKGCRLSS